jgi:MFS family permease
LRSALPAWRAASCSRRTASGIVGFAIVHGLLLGAFGSACTFAPLVADTALWFVRRRGIAVAVCASGNYLAGAIWPPLVQWGIEHHGWRDTYIALGLICGVGLAALVPWMRERPPALAASKGARLPPVATDARPFGLAPTPALVLLCIAGVACCVAMAMPQVHIVAYCGDLGFGAARGAEMLSLMLACGIASRLHQRRRSATASAACAPCCSARRCRGWR